MTDDEFVKTYLNKAVDYDGAYGVQCVDLAKLYIEIVLRLFRSIMMMPIRNG